MKLEKLIEELEKQKPLKWDKKLNSSQIEMGLDENRPVLQIEGENSFFIAKPCHSQIAEKLEIPLKYYHKICNVSAKFGQMKAFLKLQIICDNLKLGEMHDTTEKVQSFA